MATGSRPDSVFYGVYDKYVGEARTKPQVYGYWVFVLGLLSAIAAGGVLAVGTAVDLGLAPLALEEIVVVLGGCAGIGLLLGAVLQLPLRRRAIYVAVLGSVASLAAVGFFFRLYPRSWNLATTPSRAVAAAYVGGLGVVAVVAALIPVVTGRRSLLLDEEPAETLSWMVDEEATASGSASAVMLGEATRDGVFAVFPSDGGWRWWFVEQAAVADSVRDYETQTKAELALDGIKEKVEAASLLEITHAAFRLYRADGSADGTDGAYRWRLVDEDGIALADSDGPYDTRGRAENAVNLLKEHGPNAARLDVDDGAFELYGSNAGDASGASADDGERVWRWRLVDEDRGTLAAGPGGYDERAAAEEALAAARQRIPSAPLMDVEYVGFELIEVDGGSASSPADADGEWRWRLVDAADDPILESAATFPDREAAEASVARLAEGAIDAPFLETGSPAYEVVAHEDGGWGWRLVDDDASVVATCEEPVPSAESGRTVVGRIKDVVADASVIDLDDAAFEVYPEGDRWAWRLVTEDRETVAECPQTGYEAEAAAQAAVERVREEIERADRIEFDSSAFHLYEAPDGGWNWRLVDGDGSVVSDSGQEHASKEDAAAAMNTMKEHAPDADLVEIETATLELYEADGNGGGSSDGAHGAWHWRLVGADGETLATSPGRYGSADAAREGMETLELLAPNADGRTMDAAAFQVYTGAGEDRRWRWRLIHPDGTIVARSEDGFASREDAEAAAESVAAFAADATVHTIEDIAVRFGTRERTVDDEGTTVTEWNWEVVDGDRSRLATGTEVFDSRDGVAERGRLFRDHAGAASVFRADPVAFRLEEGSGGVASGASDASSDSSDGGWHWRLVDFDRNTLAVGTRTHDERADARADLERVQELATDADLLDFDVAAFEIVEDGHGWRWRFIDTAGTVIGRSGSTFGSRREAQRALGHLRASLSDASLLDIDSPAFELHEDDGGDGEDTTADAPLEPSGGGWRWRLVDTDGSTLAESMRTYPTRREAREALDSLRSFGGDAATAVEA